MEKYSIINKDEKYYFIKSCPIVIVAQAIVRNNVNNKVHVQLKFNNLSSRKIKAVYISLLCYGVSGEKYDDVKNFAYLDLEHTDIEFGEKNAIILPDNRIRMIKCILNKVVYLDGTTSIYDCEYIDFLEKEKKVYSEYVEQYMQEIGDRNHEHIYKLIERDEYWICSCGRLNFKNQKCFFCKFDREVLKKKGDYNYLSEKIDEQKKKQQEDRIKLAEQKKKNRKLIKKAIAISLSSFVAIGIIALCIYYMTIVKPTEEKYQTAISDIESCNYEEALKLFNELGDYKDSNKYIIQMIPDYLEELALNGEIELGKELMEKYLNSSSFECDRFEEYCKGLEILSNEDYVDAFPYFTTCGEFFKAEDYKMLCQYNIAVDIINESDYTKYQQAYNFLSTLAENNYLDSKELLENMEKQPYTIYFGYIENSMVSDYFDSLGTTVSVRFVGILEFIEQDIDNIECTIIFEDGYQPNCYSSGSYVNVSESLYRYDFNFEADQIRTGKVTVELTDKTTNEIIFIKEAFIDENTIIQI